MIPIPKVPEIHVWIVPTPLTCFFWGSRSLNVRYIFAGEGILDYIFFPFG